MKVTQLIPKKELLKYPEVFKDEETTNAMERDFEIVLFEMGNPHITKNGLNVDILVEYFHAFIKGNK